ncbi:hypothetical protein, partial [Sphingorhabdus sp.]|uniref:hypothetical protein n=1 Tax=Sphingorhabdus sp. TaxID=1902408 RepID=UPI004048CBE9
MPRSSTPALKTDDTRFPVRLKFAVPTSRLGWELARLHQWLTDNLGCKVDDLAGHRLGEIIAFREGLHRVF